MPLEDGLRRLRELTAPGGALVIVGLAREQSMWDHIVSLSALVPNKIALFFRGNYEHESPIKDPRESFAEVKDAATGILPGVVYRRHLYWRYSLVWLRSREADVDKRPRGDAF